ncbi:MAG: hypothetical protein A4E57_03958 [Syntrophorhabdaceae bacterium PtaU1.Bin034]|nr:MAG: hypothetical protein A4E57_03958 [Syntrophorhabdaceae bacterium PtaU1.Bin034]
MDLVLQALRKILAHCRYSFIDAVRNSNSVCLGKGEDNDLGRSQSAGIGVVGVSLLTEVYPSDIAQPHYLGSLIHTALYDDVLELVAVGQPAETADGKLKGLTLGHRRRPELTRDNLYVLITNNIQHIGCGEAELF